MEWIFYGAIVAVAAIIWFRSYRVSRGELVSRIAHSESPSKWHRWF